MVQFFSRLLIKYGRLLQITILILLSGYIQAQKVENIYFNLYTDSLKKGVHNYINLDAKLSNGKYLPLNYNKIVFSSNAGVWEGNCLIIDSSYTRDSVEISAYYKENPKLTKKITLFIKKNPDDAELMTEEEFLRQLRKN